MATLTVYPDPHPEVSTVDGWVARTGVDESLTLIRSSAGTVFGDNTNGDYSVHLRGSATTDQYDTSLLSIYTFDTSAIPDTDTVTGVVLGLVCLSKQDTLGQPDINITYPGSAPGSATTLANLDYDRAASQTPIYGALTWANIIADDASYSNVTLNSDGIAHINKTGVTSFASQLSWMYNTTGLTWSSAGNTRVYTYYADETGTAKDPKLVVTYSSTNPSVSDNITVTENVLLKIDGIVTSDNVAVSESLQLFIPTFAKVLTDNITVTDTPTVAIQANMLSVFFNGVDVGALADTLITAINIHERPNRKLEGYKLARHDGSQLVNAEYAEKIVSIRGHIASSTQAVFEANRDTLMNYLDAQEATLKVLQAGAYRLYTATTANVIWTEDGGGFGVFDIEFVCSIPFGQDTTSVNSLSLESIINATSRQTFNDIAGNYQAEPTITVLVNTLTGGVSKYIMITNPHTSKFIKITRTWLANDSLVIDCMNQTAKVNGTLVDYTGVFPTWAVGQNSVQYDDSLTTRFISLSFVYTKRYI